MKKLFLAFLLTGSIFYSFAQAPDADQLHETAKAFMRQGDYTNAELVLGRSLQQSPNSLEILKDLALNYYFQKNFTKALETIKPLLDRDDADDQCFQIAGNVYKGLDQKKECEKVYKKGLKKFPESGSLYNEYAELLNMSHDPSAIKQWEKGIETDPGYSGNYYNAAKYYQNEGNYLWSILYSEIFLNIEVVTSRTAEVKNMILDSYKRIFTSASTFTDIKNRNAFEQAYLETLSKQNSIASNGISPETLTMIRTRFLLDWQSNYSTKFPFRLFDYQIQLLRAGMFPAYNQWIFGAAQNVVAYQNWTEANPVDYNDFVKFQKGRIFKMQPQQYYHK